MEVRFVCLEIHHDRRAGLFDLRTLLEHFQLACGEQVGSVVDGLFLTGLPEILLSDGSLEAACDW